MRLLIVSDIHANPWALDAVERDAGRVDAVICAGDTVNYGAGPGAIITWLRDRGAVTVRGNHDHAVAFAADPRASVAKQRLVLAMRDWTREQLSAEDIAWLVALPRQSSYVCGDTSFAIYHATPLDPLYDYRLTPGADDGFVDRALHGVSADVLVLGHTHLPLTRQRGPTRIINPGSVGQPLDGDPRAAYAIWDNGKLELRRVEYDRDAAAAALSKVSIPPDLVRDLVETLRRGALPA